jgi:hypothetical protein
MRRIKMYVLREQAPRRMSSTVNWDDTVRMQARVAQEGELVDCCSRSRFGYEGMNFVACRLESRGVDEGKTSIPKSFYRLPREQASQRRLLVKRLNPLSSPKRGFSRVGQQEACSETQKRKAKHEDPCRLGRVSRSQAVQAGKSSHLWDNKTFREPLCSVADSRTHFQTK